MIGRLFFLLFIAKKISVVFAACSTVWNNPSIPKTVRIGAMFPKLNHDGSGTANNAGNQQQAAFMMAVKELNDKNDSHYDCILPNTHIEVAIEESGNFIENVYASIHLYGDTFNKTGRHLNSSSIFQILLL